MTTNNIVIKNLEELAESSLSLNDKIKKLPILIICNDSNTRDSLDLFFQKKGFEKVLTAKNTGEVITHVKKKGIKDLLRFCIMNLDLGEKYFVKEDFDNLAGLDSEQFWKNCIQDKVMTIIGEIGVPLSYDRFLKRIKKFGTVDNNLAENMKEINKNVKNFDTELLISSLQKRDVLSDIHVYYIIQQTENEHFIELQKKIVDEKKTYFKNPIDVQTIYEQVNTDCKKLIEKLENPYGEMEGFDTLSDAQKKELMTTSQKINALIDSRAKSIGIKYNDKLDFDEIEKAKKQIYKIMFHYAVKNELQYFQYFIRGLKGVFFQLEDELKFSDIRQCFLFQNILKRISIMDYTNIKKEIKQCGIIVLLIISNFVLMEKNGIPTVPKFNPMLFYRALGIVFLWSDQYAGQLLKLLSRPPNYHQFFLIKENRTKRLSGQNYQNLHRRFLSFTEKVFQVDKCSNLEKLY